MTQPSVAFHWVGCRSFTDLLELYASTPTRSGTKASGPAVMLAHGGMVCFPGLSLTEAPPKAIPDDVCLLSAREAVCGLVPALVSLFVSELCHGAG